MTPSALCFLIILVSFIAIAILAYKGAKHLKNNDEIYRRYPKGGIIGKPRSDLEVNSYDHAETIIPKHMKNVQVEISPGKPIKYTQL